VSLIGMVTLAIAGSRAGVAVFGVLAVGTAANTAVLLYRLRRRRRS
jgi:hypothetical protein